MATYHRRSAPDLDIDGATLERIVDGFEKSSFLAQDKALCLRERKILLSFSVVLQARSVRFVIGERPERNQAPRHVIGALMREEIADQMTATTWNDLGPIFGIGLEGSALKRVDFVANKAGNSHSDESLQSTD